MASNDSREFAPVLVMVMSHVARHVLESFSPDELRALEQLTLREWSHFNRLLRRLMKLKVEFDHPHVATLLAPVRREAVSEQLQDELLRRGVSFPLMQALVGWTHQHFTAQRKALGLAGRSNGRPRALSEAEQVRLWRRWQQHAGLTLDAERCLAIAQETGLPLNLIWSYGEFQTWRRQRAAN